MRIKSIQIENFQCFYKNRDSTLFEFEPGVNIIAGKNGSGKSKLFNAFHWVLFGTIYSYSGSKKGWIVTSNSDLRFISKRAKHKCEIGEEVKCSVELVLKAQSLDSKESHLDYTFNRTIKVEKIANGNFKISKPEALEISYKRRTGETEFIDELKNEKIIDNIFPPALRKYMWFQGEALDSLLDFGNPNTLKLAIQKISYYPYYERIHKIISESNRILTKNINKHLRKSKTTDTELKQIIDKISLKSRELESNQKDLVEAKERYDKIEEKLADTESKLQNYEGYKEFNQKLKDIEHQDQIAKIKIENLESSYRENFVNKWMLRGIEELLKEADSILEQFSEVIKEKSETDNPVPMKVPGKKYINQMLDDEYCHICERPAPKNSEEYKAIKKRLGESEAVIEKRRAKNNEFKELEYSYMQLVNMPEDLLDDISEIYDEIQEWDKEAEDLFGKRLECIKEKEKLKAEIDINAVKKGASKAKELSKNLMFYVEEEKKQKSKVKRFNKQKIRIKSTLKSLKEKRKELEGEDEKIKEQEAEPYFNILESITEELKEKALVNLINDIEDRANDLYKKYLENSDSPSGYLSIDRDTYKVLVLDEGKRKDINTGHEVAAKMSVINSILSLSSEMIGKSYPLVADAPSSVFDKDNTKSYTEKIKQTFGQVILISKDYATEDDLEFLKELDQIERVYLIENKLVKGSDKKNEINNYTRNYIIKR